MSYILEALKKAQAERQLGSAPSIHAAQLHPAPVAARASRLPVAVALGAVALTAGAAVVLLMRPTPATAPAAVLVPAPERVPLPAPKAPVVIAAAPVPVPPAPVKAEPVAPKTAAPKPAPPPEPAAPVLAVATPAPAPAPVEDNAPPLTQLPDNIQREVPQIAMGGYIYSPIPSERLLLIDKMLRREGEEVAPGLTLERLLPKAAILNYRGYRYRVPY